MQEKFMNQNEPTCHAYQVRTEIFHIALVTETGDTQMMYWEFLKYMFVNNCETC
jgi:hypothetical protein